MLTMSTKKKTDDENKDTDHAGLPHDAHALAGAAVVSGAVTGAAVGAVAGPLGVVVGGAIGTAVGAVAGVTMEREAHRNAEHEKELDDEMGVTKGSLGVPKEAKEASPSVLAEAEEAERKHQEELDKKGYTAP